MTVLLPNASQAFLDRFKKDDPDPAYRRWMENVTDALNAAGSADDLQALIDHLSTDGTIEGIPEPSELELIQGIGIAITNGNTIALRPLADSGDGALLGITRDAYGRVSGTTDATITGTADQIDVANGDAVNGPPTISLANLANAGGGTLQLITRDAKGRISGSSAADAADVPYDNASSGLTADDVQEAIDELAAGSVGTPDTIPTDLAMYLVDSDGNYIVDSDGNYVVAIDATTMFWQLFKDKEWAGDLSMILDGVGSGYIVTRYSTDVTGPQYRGQKAGGSEGTPAAVLANYVLFSMQGRGHTGSTMGGNAGDAQFRAIGTFTGSDHGCTFRIRLCPAGSTTVSTAFEIDSNRAIVPGADNAQDLGTSALRYANAYSRQFRPGSGTPIWTSGTGTPEGAVTAPVGSLFTRTDGGAGTTLYVKETGAGNTGWAAK